MSKNRNIGNGFSVRKLQDEPIKIYQETHNHDSYGITIATLTSKNGNFTVEEWMRKLKPYARRINKNLTRREKSVELKEALKLVLTAHPAPTSREE